MLECQMSDIITNIKASQSVSEWEGSGTLCRVIGESLSIIVCMVFFLHFALLKYGLQIEITQILCVEFEFC